MEYTLAQKNEHNDIKKRPIETTDSFLNYIFLMTIMGPCRRLGQINCKAYSSPSKILVYTSHK